MSTTQQPARPVVMLDVETSGRYVERGHGAWEVAWWNLTTGVRAEFMVWIENVSKYLAAAELEALRVSRFIDRWQCPTARGATVDALWDMLTEWWPQNLGPDARPVILGSKPTFDMGFVAKLIKDFGIAKQTRDGQWPYAEPWHHHPIDLGSYAAGVLGVPLGTQSLSAESVARMVGVKPGGHSAMGDVLSGGRAYLLLREAVRVAGTGAMTARAWLDQYDAASLSVESVIEAEFGPEVDVPF